MGLWQMPGFRPAQDFEQGLDFGRVRHEGRVCFQFFQEFEGVQAVAFFQRVPALLPGADGNDHVGIAFCLQLFDGTNFPSADEVRAEGFAKGDIFFDGLCADPEAGNHVGDHAAGSVFALKDGHRHTGAAQERR